MHKVIKISQLDADTATALAVFFIISKKSK